MVDFKKIRTTFEYYLKTKFCNFEKIRQSAQGILGVYVGNKIHKKYVNFSIWNLPPYLEVEPPSNTHNKDRTFIEISLSQEVASPTLLPCLFKDLLSDKS